MNMSPEFTYPGVYLEAVPSQKHSMDGVSAKMLSELKAIAACVRKCGHGTRVLFTGPHKKAELSAALALARELQVNLYRIDLSAVENKYIGETEKNLRRLFDAAEQGGAILFFDEADALFGKRSEVKDSHDRYANLEVSYLLQRIEDFEGLVILATNSEKNIAPAFLRRFHSIIPFPLTSRNRIAKPKKKRTTDD